MSRPGEDPSLPRRTVLLGGLGLVGGLGVASIVGCGRPEPTRLSFLNWQDYIDRQLLTDFTAETGSTVTYETYASNDELLRRLNAASGTKRRGRTGKTFDLIVPSGDLVRTLRDADQLLPLPDNVEGLDNLDPAMRRLSFDPGNRYTVPWATGTTGIGYSQRAFPDSPPDWSTFLDPKVRGKATVLDETRDAMALALFMLGEDPNTEEPSVIRAAGKQLARVVANRVDIDAKTYLRRLRRGETILAQAYSTDVAQAMKENDDLAFVLPASGSLRWVDSLCIPRGAGRATLAAEFISFYLRPQISATNAAAIRADTGNAAARRFLPEDLLADPIAFPSESTLATSVFIAAVDKKAADLYRREFAKAKG